MPFNIAHIVTYLTNLFRTCFDGRWIEPNPFGLAGTSALNISTNPKKLGAYRISKQGHTLDFPNSPTQDTTQDNFFRESNINIYFNMQTHLNRSQHTISMLFGPKDDPLERK